MATKNNTFGKTDTKFENPKTPMTVQESLSATIKDLIKQVDAAYREYNQAKKEGHMQLADLKFNEWRFYEEQLSAVEHKLNETIAASNKKKSAKWTDYGLTVRQLIITTNRTEYYKFRKKDKAKAKLYTYIKINKRKVDFDDAIKNTRHVVKWYSKKNKKGRDIIHVVAKKVKNAVTKTETDKDIVPPNPDDTTITIRIEDYVTQGGDICRRYITEFVLSILQKVAKINLSDKAKYNTYYESIYKMVDEWLLTVIQMAEDPDDEGEIIDLDPFQTLLAVYTRFYYALRAKPKNPTSLQKYAYDLINEIRNDIGAAYPKSLPTIDESLPDSPLLFDVADYCQLVLDSRAPDGSMTEKQIEIYNKIERLYIYILDAFQYDSDAMKIDAVSDDFTKLILNGQVGNPIKGIIYLTPDGTKWEFDGTYLIPYGTDLPVAMIVKQMNVQLTNVYNYYKKAAKFYIPAITVDSITEDRTKVVINGTETAPRSNVLYINSESNIVFKLNTSNSRLEAYNDKDGIATPQVQKFFGYMLEINRNLEIAGFIPTLNVSLTSFKDVIISIRDITSALMELNLITDVISEADNIIINKLKKEGSTNTWVGYSKVISDISSLLISVNEISIDEGSENLYIDAVSEDRTKIIVNGKETKPVKYVHFITKDGIVYEYNGEILEPISINTDAVDQAMDNTVIINAVTDDLRRVYYNGAYYDPIEGVNYIIAKGDVSYVYKYDKSKGILVGSIDLDSTPNLIVVNGITEDKTRIIYDGKTLVPLIGFIYSYSHDNTTDLYEYNGTVLSPYNENISEEIEINSTDMRSIDGITSDNMYVVINGKQFEPIEGIRYKLVDGNTEYIFMYDDYTGLYIYDSYENPNGSIEDDTEEPAEKDEYPNVVKIDSEPDNANFVIINGVPYKAALYTKYVCNGVYYVYDQDNDILVYKGEYTEPTNTDDEPDTPEDNPVSPVAINDIKITLTLPDGTVIEPTENTMYTSPSGTWLYSNGQLYKVE